MGQRRAIMMKQADIMLGLIVALVVLSAAGANAQLPPVPVPCNGDAARCHTGSFTLLLQKDDGSGWIPQKPYGISEGDCRTWAVITARLEKSVGMKTDLAGCIADDHHIGYVYNPDTDTWYTVTP